MKSKLTALAAATGVIAASLLASAPAHAAPAAQPPIVVSLGDSFISGEGGRWAGNTNKGYQRVDALGPTAYFDNSTRTGERIPLCHRSRTSPIHIGSGVTSVNLACSGATTKTRWDGKAFKPGLDFYSDGKGNRGQAAMLQTIERAYDVKMIVVSIGGNDFKFAPIIKACVTNFLTSSSKRPNLCSDDPTVLASVSPVAATQVAADIAQGLRNVQQAMRNAGREDGSYDIVLQLYPSPIPAGRDFRYSQTGYTRQTVGGCGFWNTDADWAGSALLPTVNTTVRLGAVLSGVQDVHILDTSRAFDDRRLCERNVGLLEEQLLQSWKSRYSVDLTEWVTEVRTVSSVLNPYQVQESLHPNYWGQQALQRCIRLAWNKGEVRGGTCTIARTGVASGEPIMQLD